MLAQPPYTAGFAEGLAYMFANQPAAEVSLLLNGFFPEADEVDCDYLLEVLAHIEETRYCEQGVGCGVAFVFWGTEYAPVCMAAAREWVAVKRAALGQT
ncbi:hypothetical protein ASU33_14210 [Solirubrum puertoriconensis]|uniref:CdiI immunity protein domain-containing protein n=2 Tax=Solirubrum puertoriconensis TaxID=1751427 RepID=A0A9X0L4D5_SOLP1|nr:hypothetical protein ASU33_14210 [Solirubrum puertoriconensis]